MREIMKKIMESIEWTIVIVVFLGIASSIVAIFALFYAIAIASVLPLLLLFPAALGGALAVGIYAGDN